MFTWGNKKDPEMTKMPAEERVHSRTFSRVLVASEPSPVRLRM